MFRCRSHAILRATNSDRLWGTGRPRNQYEKYSKPGLERIAAQPHASPLFPVLSA
ncbi:hypothetical protein IE4803_CH01707 [Rhizobium etli bv. phaseoli str. IE4803]|nr:hypothetical protein IE4803_CH01707 [Rhizobium etli bv. phaseoli str. IE4803]